MNIHPFTILLSHLEIWATHGGYLFLFLASILEALPLIGSTIPGHTIVILSGFLARVGIFNIWIVMALASLGAILGDAVGYYIGRFYGVKFIERYKRHFFFKEEYIDKARKLIAEHTGKALVVGRFNPITRPFMPLLVGSSHAHAAKFWIYDILSCISWSVLSVMLGYVFGIGYHNAAKVFGQAALIALIVAIIAIWGYNFVNKRFHIFKKYELFILTLNLLALWGLVETMQDAWAAHSFMANFDIWVNVFMASHVTPTMATVAKIVTNLGSAAAVSIVGVLVAVWLFVIRKWRSAVIMAASILSTSLFLELMKAFFLRARPVNALQLIVNDPSFPSGHAALAAAFFVVVAYLLAPRIHNQVKRELVIVVCVLATIAIGLSRIVLNVHWASDVVAGWALGVFCATTVILLVRYVGALVLARVNH